MQAQLSNADEAAVVIANDDEWGSGFQTLLDFEDGTGNCTGDAAANTQINGHYTLSGGPATALTLSIGIGDPMHNNGDPAAANPPFGHQAMFRSRRDGHWFFKVDTTGDQD